MHASYEMFNMSQKCKLINTKHAHRKRQKPILGILNERIKPVHKKNKEMCVAVGINSDI